MRRRRSLDTKAVASEIILLKNRLAELEEQGQANTVEWNQLHDRLGSFQEQLAGAPGRDGDAAVAGSEVRYVPPV